VSRVLLPLDTECCFRFLSAVSSVRECHEWCLWIRELTTLVLGSIMRSKDRVCLLPLCGYLIIPRCPQFFFPPYPDIVATVAFSGIYTRCGESTGLDESAVLIPKPLSNTMKGTTVSQKRLKITFQNYPFLPFSFRVSLVGPMGTVLKFGLTVWKG